MSGLQYVSAQSAYDPTDEKSVTVQCPAGKKVVGGGASITSITSGAPIALTSSQPLNALNHFFARARETAAYGNNWRVIAIALCATVAP